MLGTSVAIEPIHHHHHSGSSNGELNEESKRLETFFRWPKPSIIEPEKLARFGFYYTGARDIVKCYFCLVELGSWERTDDAAREHLRWSRHCPLMTRRQTNNVPLDENFLNDFPQPAFDTVGVRSQQMSPVQQAVEEPIASGSLRLIDAVPAAPYNLQAMAKNVQACYSLYIPAQQRLKTFNDWPIALSQKPEELVEAGFFYTGKSDLVVCFSCGGQLKGWKPGDDPWEEHAKFYDICYYLRRKKPHTFIDKCKAQKAQQMAEPSELNVGKNNVRESSEASEDEKRSETAESKLYKVCYATVGVKKQRLSPAQQAAEEPITSRSLRLTDAVPVTAYNRQAFSKEVQASKVRSKYPSYVHAQQRLKTFDEWPIALSQKPEELVQAGFFYTGKSDQVACFSCGGQLKGWEPADDPWEEHAKFYDGCDYLKRMKTRTFIDNCKAQNTQQMAEPSKLTVGKDNLRKSSEASEDEKRSEPAESKLCKVCNENEYNTLFMPCGHVVACRRCAASVQRCPLCNEPFTNVFRVYCA